MLPFALIVRYAHYLTPCVRVQMGSVRGRLRSSRFPSRLDSEARFLVKGPQKGPGATEILICAGAQLKLMMASPIGFRVSGPFQRKGPINKPASGWLVTNSGHQPAVINEGGLLRSPPE